MILHKPIQESTTCIKLKHCVGKQIFGKHWANIITKYEL